MTCRERWREKGDCFRTSALKNPQGNALNLLPPYLAFPQSSNMKNSSQEVKVGKSIRSVVGFLPSKEDLLPLG